MQRTGLNTCGNTCVSLMVVLWRCSAKSLVKELLTTNPSKRLSASQALKHTWFTASLQSNEDLRLARRNMKRNLRLRFKVSWFWNSCMLCSPQHGLGPRLPPGRYTPPLQVLQFATRSRGVYCTCHKSWSLVGPATNHKISWTSNNPCNQYVACSSSLHMPGS